MEVEYMPLVNTTFSENELSRIDKQRKPLGLSRSAYCRMAVNQLLIEHEVSADERKGIRTMTIHDGDRKSIMKVVVVEEKPDPNIGTKIYKPPTE